ncbi:MAG: hypothetical protein R3213_09045 [Flavobacteriaceae bacterium]|nr:hypothetical protein [Flavobacteriaceae bacterium]
MKRFFLSTAMVLALAVTANSCRDTDNADDLDDAVENAEDAVENAADETGQAVEGAFEKTGQAIDDAVKETKEAGEAVERALDTIDKSDDGM